MLPVSSVFGMTSEFKIRLTLAMIIDFAACAIIHTGTKYLFANLEPPEIVKRGRERRDKRRAEEKASGKVLTHGAGITPLAVAKPKQVVAKSGLKAVTGSKKAL